MGRFKEFNQCKVYVFSVFEILKEVSGARPPFFKLLPKTSEFKTTTQRGPFTRASNRAWDSKCRRGEYSKASKLLRLSSSRPQGGWTSKTCMAVQARRLKIKQQSSNTITDWCEIQRARTTAEVWMATDPPTLSVLGSVWPAGSAVYPILGIMFKH